ncbi:MAG: hypothetical protein ABEJ70_08645 [Halobacteriaceae archaeon]
MDAADALADARASERAARRFVLLLLGSVPLVYFGLTAIALGHLRAPVVVAGLLAVLLPYATVLNVWGMSLDARVEFGMLCGVLFAQAAVLGAVLAAAFGATTLVVVANPLVRFFQAIVVTSVGALVFVVLSYGVVLARRTYVRSGEGPLVEEVPEDSD